MLKKIIAIAAFRVKPRPYGAGAHPVGEDNPVEIIRVYYSSAVGERELYDAVQKAEHLIHRYLPK